MKASEGDHSINKHRKTSGLKVQRKYPDYFPGTVKFSASVENHLFFCALACVQESLEMIPRAKTLFDDIIGHLGKPGCRKISEKINENARSFARTLSKITGLYLQKKRFQLALARLTLLLKMSRLLPFLFGRDFCNLFLLVRRFIVEVFNRDPEKPKITTGTRTGVLIFAVTIARKTSASTLELRDTKGPYALKPKPSPGRHISFSLGPPLSFCFILERAPLP